MHPDLVLAEQHRREKPSLHPRPTVPDYAESGNLIDLAVHHLDEALPTGQRRRAEAAYRVLVQGVRDLGAAMQATGYTVQADKPDLEGERKVFEEKLFGEYFIKQVKHTGKGGPMELMPAPDTKTKEEFFKRTTAEQGDYEDNFVSAMWFAWKLARGVLR